MFALNVTYMSHLLHMIALGHRDVYVTFTTLANYGTP